MPDDKPTPELTMEAVVDLAVETFQRQIAEGAEDIRRGLEKWAHVEEHTKRWLPELPAQLKGQGSQIDVSVQAVVDGASDAAKRMKGESMPPIEVHKGGLKAVAS